MPSTPRERGLAILWIALANAIGGFSYPAQKAALEGLPPATVTLLRNVVSLLALLALARARRLSFRSWSRRDLGRAFVLGTLAFALPMYLGIVGVERSSAANGSILILLEPVTIVALAGLLLGEKIGGAKLASIVLGLAGALAIVLEGGCIGGVSSLEIAGRGERDGPTRPAAEAGASLDTRAARLLDRTRVGAAGQL